jgi:hypothetical protein
MEISKSIDYNMNFIINKYNLDSLNDLFKKNNILISFSIDLSDNTSISKCDLDDLLKLSNTKERQIKRISIRGNSKDNLYIILNLRETQYCESVSLYISGDETKVVYMKEKVEDWINSIKPWYSIKFILEFDSYFLKFIFLLIGLALAAGIIYLLSKGLSTEIQTNKNSQTVKELLINNLGGYLLGAFPFLILFIFNKIRLIMFPIAIFEIGNGIERKEKIEKIRSLFGWGFIASIIVTIIGIVLDKSFT